MSEWLITCTWACKYILYFMPACLRLSTQNRYSLVAVKNETDRKCVRPSRQNDMMNYQGLYVTQGTLLFIQRTLVLKVCHAVANYKLGNFSNEYSMYRIILCKPCLIFLSAIHALLLESVFCNFELCTLQSMNTNCLQ